ncbi:MAG TPA: Ig-like domain-containing protein, partial [Symbiobacteriaceae bacterium]|nr:Ig-like domain-containing protein [Symbiobacteriaceae bacterium]
MESSTFDGHLGQTVSFRTQISNSIPGNCDLANMTVTLTTPDGVEHVVATDLYVSAGTETPWYEVSYVIAAGNLVNNEVVASARASGLSRLNDRTVTGTASSSVRVTPVVGALAICTQGAGPEGPAQIAVSGTTTDAPGGSGISVSVAGASTVTTTALDGTWSVAMAWNGTGGSANVTAAVSFGDGNTGSVTTALVIPAVQMNGGESVTSMSKRPVISGTTTGSAVTVTIGGTSVPVAANGGTWSLTWPTDLAYGSYTVRASVDGACALDTQGLAINNTAPAATDDAYSTLEDTTLNVPAPGVLANDIDLNGDPLTAVLVEAPLHGTLALDPSGSFVYTPAANYHGSDSFKYKANDGMADSYQAIVTITIGSVDDQPAAVNDAYSTPEDMTLTVPAASGVLANDSDADGDAMAADKISNPSHGTVTLNPDGSLTYQPDANFNGTDTFRYIVNAGGNESNVATVTITVGNANDPPVSEDKEYSTDEDVPLVVTVPGLLRDAIDPDGDPVTAIKTGDPAHGTVSVNPDGSFTYTPALNYFGSDSFTFMVNDGTANSNESTVFLYVAPVNDA